MKAKMLFLILALTLLFSFTAFADNGAASSSPDSRTIVILHTNDVH